MPTKHRRINVTFKPEVVRTLSMLSEKYHTSLSNITQELVEEALALREDLYFSKLAEDAEKRAKGKPAVAADKLWKELGLE